MIFLFTCRTSETYEELNKAFVWFMIVLSFTGLYMYKTLMTTEAGKLYDGCVGGLNMCFKYTVDIIVNNNSS